MITIGTSDKLEVVLGGVVTANELQVTAGYIDTSDDTPGNNALLTNGTTDIIAVASPSSGLRQIYQVTVYNADTVDAVVTVKVDDGASEFIQRVATLGAGETLAYEHDAGWQVLTDTSATVGDMTKAVYDPANITEQVVGLTETQTLTNKTLTSPVVNTPTGIVKGDVGLGNVDNTSDANKPVSSATQTAIDGVDKMTTKGDLLTFSTINARLGVGSDTQVLTADSTQATGVKWATPASGGMTDPMTTRGDIIIKDASNNTARLAVGTAGQVLGTDGTDIAWSSAGSGDVSKVGTPVDNQVAVWTGDGTAEGTAGLTYDGTNVGITGNIVISGTVDGIDIATDVGANNSKVTNATHSGDVTGDGALTIAGDAVTYAKMQNVVSDQVILGNIGGAGTIVTELTATQVRTLINVADGATANAGTVTSVAGGTGLTSTGGATPSLSHDSHSGDVTGATALTIANDAVTYAKMQNVVADNVILGNNSGADSVVDELTATEVRTLINVADGATANAGTVTSVTGGTGLSSTGGATPDISHDAHTGDVTGSTALTIASSYKEESIEFVFDGGGSAIATGVGGYIEVGFNCTITAVRMFPDQSTTTVVDIWKDTYANYPPLDADSITASAPPTVTATTKSEDTTLTGWTKTISAGDILAFNIDSNNNAEKLTVSLTVTRTV